MSEMPPLTPEPMATPHVAGLPWEEPNAGLGSIVPTLMRFVTRPGEAYSQLNPDVDLVRPLAYFVALALLGACISQVWSYFLFDSYVGVIRSLAGSSFDKFAPLLSKPGGIHLAFGLVITPLVALIVLFIWAALVHLALTLVGGANRGFAATLRVLCYAQSTQLAVLMPGLGGFVAFVWRLILEIIGLAQVHKTEGWKAAMAVLLPLLLCCVCVATVLVAFGAAVGQALQQLK